MAAVFVGLAISESELDCLRDDGIDVDTVLMTGTYVAAAKADVIDLIVKEYTQQLVEADELTDVHLAEHDTFAQQLVLSYTDPRLGPGRIWVRYEIREYVV